MFPSNGRFVDLTHPIQPDSPVFPGDPPYSATPHARLADDGYRVTALRMGSHQGTHMDAPSHFLKDGDAIETTLLEKVCGPAFILDLEHKGSPGAFIEVSDLLPYADRILSGCRLLLRTGWDRQYNEPGYFTNSPGLSPDACAWLAARRVALLGLDLPTLHPEIAEETHVPLLQVGTAIVESLKLSELAQSKSEWVYFVAAPLHLVGIDGSPVRAFAIDRSDISPGAEEHIRIVAVCTATEMLAALHIREKVFVEEQGVDFRIERDAMDRQALHLLAHANGAPVGTVRLIRSGTQGTVGRFAVLKSHRGQGIGKKLMQWIIQAAPAMGLKSLHLHAQKEAADFYGQAGFKVSGPEFVEAGILHVPMARSVF